MDVMIFTGRELTEADLQSLRAMLSSVPNAEISGLDASVLPHLKAGESIVILADSTEEDLSSATDLKKIVSQIRDLLLSGCATKLT